MEKILNEISLSYSDNEINNIIKSSEGDNPRFSSHFNQNEEFFIKLDKEFIIPELPVHHNIRIPQPSPRYLDALKKIILQLTEIIPQIFRNTLYFFDPGEILRPCFFQIFRHGDKQYLYLMRLDLSFRTHEAELINQGSNDFSPEYKTRNLFIEADFIPLQNVKVINGRIASFTVNQTVSQTWIGETGRGYFVQGIWIDLELTKYISKLFIPEGRRSYPYYPFSCKYRTICHSVIKLDPEGRKKHLPLLIRSMNFMLPRLRQVEKALKISSFSNTLPSFTEHKKLVPGYWSDLFQNLEVRTYLNSKDMKEFSIDFYPG